MTVLYVEMYPQILSVPEAVRDILAHNQIYLQALELGIANYTALAENLKPDVEKLIGSKVNLNTIVVAIKRFADVLQKQDVKQPSITTKAKLSLTGSIIDLDFEKENDDELSDILDEFFGKGSRYNLFQTYNHFTLLAEDAGEIRNMVVNVLKKFDGEMREGLSKITVDMGRDEQSQHYLLSLISNILYNNRIPIHSVFFTPNEMVIILNAKDAAKAYDLIRMKIG